MYHYLIKANRRYYQQHRWQIVLLLFGIMLGVAVIVAIDLVNESAQTNFRLANERIQGKATHRIVGETSLPEVLYVDLKKRFDVIAAPVINSYAKDNVDRGILFQVIGIDPIVEARFRANLGQFWDDSNTRLSSFMLSENSIVLDHASAEKLKLKAGDQFSVLTNHGTIQLHVLSLIGTSETGATDDPRFQQLIVADIGLAQKLAGLTEKLSYINLVIADEQQLQAIRNWLPPKVWIETPSEQQKASEQLTRAFQLNLSMLSLLALAVGLFLIYNTVSFSLLQRAPMLAQFRILGLSASHIRNYLLMEYALFSVLGTLLGVLVGVALAHLLMSLVTQTLSDLYVTTAIHHLWISPISIAKALSVGIMGCLFACWLPYRRAANAPAIRTQQRVEQEISAKKTHRVQLQTSCILIISAAVFSSWNGGGLLGGYLAIACWLLAAALITPRFILASCQALGQLLHKWGGAEAYPLLTMAIRDTYRNLSRTGMASMALMVAIATAVGMNVMISSFRMSLEGWLSQRLNADLYISRVYETRGEVRKLPATLMNELRNQSEVISLSSFRYVKTWVSKQALSKQTLSKQMIERKVSIIGANIPTEGEPAYQFLSGNPAVIWQKWRSPGWLIISESLANHLNIALNEAIHFKTGQQSTSFKVAGIYFDYGSDSGRALLANDAFETHWPTVPISQIGVYLSDPNNQPALIDQIQKRWGHSLNLRIISAREILVLSLEIFERTFTITDVLRLLAIIVAFSGVLSAFMAIQLERQSELRVLNALGFNRRELITLLLLQALLLGALTGLLAVPVGAALAWLLTEVINFRAFGWSIPLHVSSNILWQALLLALAASLLASFYPAWKLTRSTSKRNTPTS